MRLPGAGKRDRKAWFAELDNLCAGRPSSRRVADCPPELLADYVETVVPWAMHKLVDDFSEDQVNALINLGQYSVDKALLSKKDLSKDALTRIAKIHNDDDLTAVLAHNPNLDADIIKDWVGHPDAAVRAALAGNWATGVLELEKLAEDPSATVRTKVVSNTSTPTPLLASLARGISQPQPAEGSRYAMSQLSSRLRRQHPELDRSASSAIARAVAFSPADEYYEVSARRAQVELAAMDAQTRLILDHLLSKLPAATAWDQLRDLANDTASQEQGASPGKNTDRHAGGDADRDRGRNMRMMGRGKNPPVRGH